MNVLFTGVAGFIAYQLSIRMIEENTEVLKLDNLNQIYSVNLKYERLQLPGVDKGGMNLPDGCQSKLCRLDDF